MVVVVVEVEMVAVDMVRGVEVKVVACMVEVGTGLEEAEMVGEGMADAKVEACWVEVGMASVAMAMGVEEMVGEGMVDVMAVEGMEVEAVEAEEEMEVVTKEVGQSRLP
jgi:hypothetical protein